MGAINRPLPLGPLTALQFAICYVNLAIPSTAARVAVNIRFFQRFGVDPPTAVSAGAIDGVSGFVVQIVLFLSLSLFSDVDFDLTVDTSDLSGLVTICLIALGVIVLAAIIVLVVPSLRARLRAALVKARHSFVVLRSPTKLLQLFGGNLASQVLFGVAMAACVEAFGEHVPLTELVLINTVVSLFAGLLPIPGGIGVSEAGTDPRTHGGRVVVGGRLRGGPRLPLRQLLPATDLGMVLLPLVDPPALPVSGRRVGSFPRGDLRCVVALSDRTGG